MARLLADAQAISGIEYDISSYADVVDAIHVIQTEMGITGTTAKEASSTISGSIASMKSSWQNLLTAISSDDLPFDDYVNSFVDSVSTVAGNLMPRIQIALQGVVQLVEQLAPVIIGKIPELFAQLLPAVVNAATGLIQSLVAALPGVLSALMGALPALISGIQQIFNALVMALPQLMQSLVSALPTLIPMLIDALVSMIMTVLGVLPQIIQPIIDYLPDIIISVVDTLLNNLPVLIDGCLQLILALVAALPEIIMALVEALPGVLKSVWDAIVGVFEKLPQWFREIWDSVKDVTANLWESIKAIFVPVAEWFDTNVIQPVSDFFTGLWEKMVEIWDGICNAVKFAIDLIASILDAAFQIITLPFRFIWENCKEYVFAAWEWIKEKVSAAINAIKGVISTVMNAIKGVFTTVWNGIKNFLTPILDTIKNAISNAFNAVKNTVSNIVNGVKSTISNVWNGIKNTTSNVFNSVKSTVTNVWNGIKSAITKPIESAKNTIKDIVDKIKGFFSGMNISFPKIKLPHFSIKPKGWKIGDLLEGSIPSLGIDWYAKAMNNPMVMTRPTVFGYNAATGTLQAGGEAGSEVVSGTNTLMNLIGKVVDAKNERIIAVLIAILNAITGGNEELIEAILADKLFVIGEREFARAVKTHA